MVLLDEILILIFKCVALSSVNARVPVIEPLWWHALSNTLSILRFQNSRVPHLASTMSLPPTMVRVTVSLGAFMPICILATHPTGIPPGAIEQDIIDNIRLKGKGNLSPKVTANALYDLFMLSEYFSLWSESITTHKSALLSWNGWPAHCSMGTTITSVSWDAYDVMWSHLHTAQSIET